MRLKHQLAIGMLLAAFAISPQAAKAAFIPIPIGTGEKIMNVNDLSGVAGAEELDGFKLGYKCSYFALLWCPLFHWDGSYCMYKGDRYRSIGKDATSFAAVLGIPAARVKRPIMYWMPWGWFILGPVLFLFIASKFADSGTATANAQTAAAAQALLQDSKFRQALEVASSEGHFDINAGIDYLRSQGLSLQDAQQKMGIIVSAIANANT
jgi:hypothetical protein